MPVTNSASENRRRHRYPSTSKDLIWTGTRTVGRSGNGTPWAGPGRARLQPCRQRPQGSRAL